MKEAIKIPITDYLVTLSIAALLFTFLIFIAVPTTQDLIKTISTSEAVSILSAASPDKPFAPRRHDLAATSDTSSSTSPGPGKDEQDNPRPLSSVEIAVRIFAIAMLLTMCLLLFVLFIANFRTLMAKECMKRQAVIDYNTFLLEQRR